MTADQTVEQVASPDISTAPSQAATQGAATPSSATPQVSPEAQIAVAPIDVRVPAVRTIKGIKGPTTGNMSLSQITSGSAHTPTHNPEAGYIPGHVRLVNLTSSEINITLRGSIPGPHLLPFSKKWDAHISKPIPRKYLTPQIEFLRSTGEIDIVEVTE
jgi:hypothetical protein